MKLFTDEEISCIRTLVELGTSTINVEYYSEYYKKLYEKYLDEIKNEHYQRESNYGYSIRNINRIQKGLEKIGYSSICK